MTQISLLQIYAGKNIPAQLRIKIFSPDEWEEFVEEWLTTKSAYYEDIERLGGAGDKGRDVIGIKSRTSHSVYSWDNFQCKHYDHPLMPSDVWIEFGKLCYYTYINDYPPPDKYYFVAPCGIGTSLSNLLDNPLKLKAELIKNWDAYCKGKITKKNDVNLEHDFLNYVENFNFSIFEKITPLKLVEEHSKTKYHVVRFGGGLPERPVVSGIPLDIDEVELPYIKCLLDAYSSESGDNYIDVCNLASKYVGHLNRSRESFFSAEQLKLFSRDTLPPGVFDKLKDEIYSGTVDVFEEDHESGFKKVKSVEQEARKLAITSSALSLCCTVKDRSGICHHLANDGIYKWVEKDDEK